MATGDFTFRRARIVDRQWLGIMFDAGAARSGIPTVDSTKLSITASGGAVGTTLSSADQLLAVVGTIGSASAFLPPAYTSFDSDVTDGIMSWVKLDRIIAHDETVTIDLDAAYVADDTSDSPAVTSQAVQVRTFCDSDGVISQTTIPQRVGCGDRTKLDPSTVSPNLYIKASDTSGVGDGNTVSSFTATTGGTITVAGTARYWADGVSQFSLNGSTGCPVIEIASGGVLSSTVTMADSKNDFTVIAIYAAASTSSTPVTSGAPTKQTWTFPGGLARNFRNINDSASIANAGGRWLAGTDVPKRMAVCAFSYSHANTRNRVYGYGGVYLSVATVTSTQDHTAAITFTATGAAVYLHALLVVPSELTPQQVRQIGATFDDDANTTNLSYYIDPVSGSDSNSGLSAAAPRLTPPSYSNNDYITYGAGDRVFYKFGTEIESHVIDTRCVYNTTYSYSSQYPIVIGGYGTRSDGRFRIARRSAATGDFGNDNGNAHVLFFGLEVYAERRDVLNANYAGFATVKAETSGGCKLNLQVDLDVSRLYYDLAGDPALHIVHDCAFRYIGGKGISDNVGGNVDERWTVLSANLFDHIWYGRSSVDVSGDRPSSLFMSHSSVLCVSRNLTNYSGWYPEVASIGDWGSGAKVFTNEAVATYSSANDDTTITLTDIAAEYEHSPTGPQLVTLKRTSDSTEYVVVIKSRTSDDEFVVEGNPFSLADAGSVSDCLAHGGTPAGANSRNHGFYISSASEAGTVRAATLVTENVHIRAADHGTQMRGGGYLINNVMIDAAIGGYVSGQALAYIAGNYCEGGHRTIDNIGGPRAWGYYINSDSQTQYYGVLRENICNLGYQDELSDYADTVANTTFALQIGKGTGNEKVEVINNTIARGARLLLGKGSGAAALTATDEIRRNIVQQPTTDPDAITETILTGANLSTATHSHNIYYHPGGSGEDRFNNATENFSEWQTTTGSTGDQFLQVTFSNGDADIAEYYSTLSGGSDDRDAFQAAAVAAFDTGNLTGFTAAEILSYMRTAYRPTNLTLADGGSTYPPGAVALASDPTATLALTDTSGSALADPVTFNTSRLTTPALTRSFRLYSNDADTDGADIAVTLSGIATAVSYSQSGGTAISDLSEYTIPADDYITVTVTLDRLTEGDSQTASVEFNGGAAGTVTANYSVSVKPAVTLTQTDGNPWPDPETGSTTQGANLARTVRVTAGPSGLSGINLITTGVVSNTSDAIALTLAGGATYDAVLSLSAATVGDDQPGDITLTANGGVSETVEFLIDVAEPSPTLPVLTFHINGSEILSGQAYSLGTVQPSTTPIVRTITIMEENGIAATLGTLEAKGNLTIIGTDPSGNTIDPNGSESVTLELDISEEGIAQGLLLIPVDELDEPYGIFLTANVAASGMRSRDRSRAR
jgi:hypothetical protein